MPQLDLATFVPQIFWLAVCFAFLISYSAKVTLPQLNKAFRHRYDKIEGTKAISLSLQDQIKQLNDERQQQLTKARHYAHDHVIQATSHLGKQSAQTKQTYLSEIKQQLRTYELQLNIVEPTTNDDLKTVSMDLAQLIMDKISPVIESRVNKNNNANKNGITHDL